MFSDFIQALSQHDSLEGLVFDNQSFYPDYQLEIYYDTRPQRDKGTDCNPCQGTTINCPDYTDNHGDIDTSALIAEVAEYIKKYRKDPNRIGPIYIVC